MYDCSYDYVDFILNGGEDLYWDYVRILYENFMKKNMWKLYM